MTDRKKSIPVTVITEEQIIKRAKAHTKQNPADFSGCNLSATDALAGYDLSGASFKNALCFRLILEGCILTGCDFTGVQRMGSVDFHKCIMDPDTEKTIIKEGGKLPESIRLVD